MERSKSSEIIINIRDLIYKNPKGLTITDIYSKLGIHKLVAERYVKILLELKVIDSVGSNKKVYVPIYPVDHFKKDTSEKIKEIYNLTHQLNKLSDRVKDLEKSKNE